MVKHIILWKLSDELSSEEKESVKAGIKAGLESLVGKVPGLIECKVNISGRLDSSNCDVMLDSTLESPEALKGYAVHPEHLAVANGKVRPYTVQRTCLDYEFWWYCCLVVLLSCGLVVLLFGCLHPQSLHSTKQQNNETTR